MYETHISLPGDPEGDRERTPREVMHEYAANTVGKGAYVVALGTSSIDANLQLSPEERETFYTQVDTAVHQVVERINLAHLRDDAKPFRYIDEQP